MNSIYDTIIVGAGPGGIQVAIKLLENANKANTSIKLLVLEAGEKAGTFFTNFPVHGKLISNNKLYTGMPPEHRYSERFDWNSLVTDDKEILMRNYSQDFFPKREALVEMLNDLVDRYCISVRYNTRWNDTKRDVNGNFAIFTDNGTFNTKHLVIATGMKPSTADIQGVEFATPYKDMKNKEQYRDKRVLIIGKGNSAMESAQEILNEANVIMLASPNSVKLAYQTHYVGSVRAVNALLVDNYQLKHQAAFLDCDIEEIKPFDMGVNVKVKYKHAKDEEEVLYFDEVIEATGFVSNVDPLDSLKLGMTYGKKYPSINEDFESVDYSNLYFAGTQTHGLDYRKTFSGFIHGFRYNSMILANTLSERLGFPIKEEVITKEDFKVHLLTELNYSPNLYLQPGYVVRVYERFGDNWLDKGYVTINKFKKINFKANSLLLAVSLEYGDIHKFENVLSIPRVPGDIDESVHIHPVIRIRRNVDLDIELYELEEDLENSFLNDPKYHNSLEEILRKSTNNGAIKV